MGTGTHLKQVERFSFLSVGYAAVEAMTSLKLVERGVPKAKIALLEIPMIPVKIILTLFLTRFFINIFLLIILLIATSGSPLVQDR